MKALRINWGEPPPIVRHHISSNCTPGYQRMRLRKLKRNRFSKRETHLTNQFWWVSCVTTSKFSYQEMEMIPTWSSKRSFRPVAETLTNIFHLDIMPKICPNNSILPKEFKLLSPTRKLNALKMYWNPSMINPCSKNTLIPLWFFTKGLQKPMSQITHRKSLKTKTKNNHKLNFE